MRVHHTPPAPPSRVAPRRRSRRPRAPMPHPRVRRHVIFSESVPPPTTSHDSRNAPQSSSRSVAPRSTPHSSLARSVAARERSLIAVRTRRDRRRARARGVALWSARARGGSWENFIDATRDPAGRPRLLGGGGDRARARAGERPSGGVGRKEGRSRVAAGRRARGATTRAGRALGTRAARGDAGENRRLTRRSIFETSQTRGD